MEKYVNYLLLCNNTTMNSVAQATQIYYLTVSMDQGTENGHLAAIKVLGLSFLLRLRW